MIYQDYAKNFTEDHPVSSGLLPAAEKRRAGSPWMTAQAISTSLTRWGTAPLPSVPSGPSRLHLDGGGQGRSRVGHVFVLRYVAVDDCGFVMNPLIVDGQVHGGIAQGLAQALYEGAAYDASGQLLTGSLLDCAMPRAAQVPAFETAHTVTPSPVNRLRVKGIGEARTIAASPAVVNSVVDALAHLGVRHLDMPLSPRACGRPSRPRAVARPGEGRQR